MVKEIGVTSCSSASPSKARFDSRMVVALGIGLTLVHFLASGALQALLFDLIRILPAFLLFSASRRPKFGPRSLWFLLGLAQLVFALGDIAWDVARWILGTSPFPSPADALYLAAYPAIGLAFAWCLRSWPRRLLREVFLDSALVAFGLGLCYWALILVDPSNPSASLEERVLAFVYPLLDVSLLVVAMVIYRNLDRSFRAPTLLFIGGLVCIAMSDLLFAIATFSGRISDGSPIDAGWLVAGYFWAAASLHPDSRNPPELVTERRVWAIGLRMKGVLTVALLGPVLAQVQFSRGGSVEVPVLLGGSTILVGLAMLKAINLMKSLEDRLEFESGQLLLQAATDERLRLSREIHDVVSHTLGGVIILTEGTRRLLARSPDSPERVGESLALIEERSRSALEEMRPLLSQLREDSSPVGPYGGLEQALAHLVESSGPVEADLEFQGSSSPLPAALVNSVYRVVQESLTNASKHASGSKVRIVVTQHSDHLSVSVTNDLNGNSRTAPGSGMGIVGMRERVGLLGGVLYAGPRSDGGWEVVARLKLRGAV